MTTRTTMPPQRLSLQIEELIEELTKTAGKTGGAVRGKLEEIAGVLESHARAARSLENMLERRLKSSALPWRGECPAAPAVSADVVQLVPRSGAVRRFPRRPGSGDAA